MDDLIEALTILKRYLSEGDYHYEYPTHCEHDVMCIFVHPDYVTPVDEDRLEELGFDPNYESNCFVSLRFGGC